MKKKKIFVLAGTEDGRELTGFLLKNNFEVIASVVSDYGQSLLAKYEGLKINSKKLDADQLVEFIFENNIEILIDASHPYAVNASKNAMTACHTAKIPYLRYERETLPLTYEKIYHVDNYESAAIKASELGENIFLTTGSRNLKIFVESPALKNCNLIARILPTAEVLAECEQLKISPKNIIAMQGPFSVEMNVETFKHFAADVIVTKDSGQIGGVDTKLIAAEKLNLPVVMIDRPKIIYDNAVSNFDEALEFVLKINSH